jgi:mycothiol synthase
MLTGLRPLCRGDVDALVELARACEQVDRTGAAPDRATLEAQFDIPGLDITQAVWVLPDEAGGVAATVAAVPLPSPGAETIQVSLAVRPDHRGGDLEERLLRFAEEQAPRLRKLPDLPAVLMTGVRAEQADRAALCERLGYRPVRWFMQLERPLSDGLPEARIPDGLCVAAAEPDADAEALHLALTESFRDHWNPVELTVEQFRHVFAAPTMQPCLFLLARGPDGEPAGVCGCRVKREKNEQQGTHEGDVTMLGVRRPYRGKGLGRALLVRGLTWLRERSMTVATLDVDTQSPTGADRLYAGVGFVERKRSAMYQKELGGG